jgi:hypothetical protein
LLWFLSSGIELGHRPKVGRFGIWFRADSLSTETLEKLFVALLNELDKPENGPVDEDRLRKFAEFYSPDFFGFGPG